MPSINYISQYSWASFSAKLSQIRVFRRQFMAAALNRCQSSIQRLSCSSCSPCNSSIEGPNRWYLTLTTNSSSSSCRNLPKRCWIELNLKTPCIKTSKAKWSGWILIWVLNQPSLKNLNPLHISLSSYQTININSNTTMKWRSCNKGTHKTRVTSWELIKFWSISSGLACSSSLQGCRWIISKAHSNNRCQCKGFISRANLLGQCQICF